jgi:TIR domain/AAA domain
LKAFISYSHADDTLFDQFKTHLASLKHTGLVESWYDRKIVAGTHVDQNILSELSESRLVFLLISANFVSSDYCMNVEVQQALKQHELGKSRLVPIIVRPTADWDKLPFGKLLALPKDGKAVTSWTDRDEAWVDVVKGIRTTANDFQQFLSKQQLSNGETTRTYSEELEFLETPYTHPRAKKLRLSDLFVYPDLGQLGVRAGGSLNRSAERVVDEGGLTMIVGGRQSGKTSLLKKIVVDSLNKTQHAIYLDVKGQNLERLGEIVRRMAEKKLSIGLDECKVELIAVDNFDLGKNLEDGVRELTALNEKSKRVVVSVSPEAIFTEEFAKHGLKEADAYSINRFSVGKRKKLIDKWIAIDADESDEELRRLADRRELEIDNILRRNVVPALPGHVLLILQSLETVSSTKTELTSYGHCYNAMIVVALAKAGVKPVDLDVYVNFLTELSYAMHVVLARTISEQELNAFFEWYRAQYLCPTLTEILGVLLESGLLRKQHGKYVLYRYVSGYFAGRYIAEALSESATSDTAKKRLEYLAENAHNDDCALVLLFVSHHTRNLEVIHTIILNSMISLEEYPESELARKEFEPLTDMLAELPNAVLHSESPADSRERRSAEAEETNRLACEIDEISADLDSSDSFARLLRAFKAIEISGQLVRNRYGSLSINELRELVRETIRCGQRVAGFLLGLSSDLKDGLPEIIGDMKEEHPDLSPKEMEYDLRGFVMLVCYYSLHSLLNQLSQHLTNSQLKPLIFEVLQGRNDSFAILLRAHTRLKLEGHDTIQEMQPLVSELETNPFAMKLLAQAVADRLQLFDIPFGDKQRIAEMFQIGVSSQVAANKPVFPRR